jgi:hypothetical protein
MAGKGTEVPRSVFFRETSVTSIHVLNINNSTHCFGQAQYI